MPESTALLLRISSGNISKYDFNKLMKKQPEPPFICAVYEFGVIISIVESSELEEQEITLLGLGFSKEFIATLALISTEEEYEFIQIDRDNHPVSFLPTYNW